MKLRRFSFILLMISTLVMLSASLTQAGSVLVLEEMSSIVGGCPSCAVGITCGKECTSDGPCSGENSFCSATGSVHQSCRGSSYNQSCTDNPAEYGGCGDLRKEGKCAGGCGTKVCCTGGALVLQNGCQREADSGDACVVIPK